ncbi:trigger factor [Spiroplasma sabaudiense Ar-1343]|uniref:Trigger factor n=1 Tax=Spiroplasma sabaudiense Ar-1343 TaxID=1276257 RepID=W6A9S3_9MOLU|nr:trigger factor [Spiroplasma sabaudiense]AHI53716.1 trigger factor [Spiroplasma sabaudiense Ar-1343]
MKFEAKKLPETGQGKWIISISGDEWKGFYEKGRRKALTEVQIPGFRKGKVPKEMAEKHLSPVKVMNEAFRSAMPKAYDFAKTQKSDIQPWGSPNPNPTKISETELELEFVFDLKPEIKIEKYKGITGPKKVAVKAEKDEIAAEIKKYQERFVMEKIKEGDNVAVEDGDNVKFDFEGFINNEAFQGGKGLDYQLVIGSKNFIPGFEEAMIGLKVGIEQEIKVTFPKDYQAENLAGKEATFKISIKEIKSRILPKADDELAKDLNIKDVNTFADLEKLVVTQIEKAKNSNERNRFVNEIIDLIRKESTIELPKSAIDREVQNMRKEFEQKVIANKMTLKEYKKISGLSDEDINNEIFGDAKKRLESYLITDEVRNKEKLEATPEEIEQKYNDLASQFGISAQMLKESVLQESQVATEIVNEKIVEFIYKNNG